MEETTQTTLRDTISEQFDALEEATPAAPAPAAPVSTEPAQDDKPGRTAGRSRDEAGRLLPGKAVQAVPQAPPVAAPEVKPLQRPSSWKKEMWGHWDKLSTGQALSSEEARQIAEYNLSRESDFAKGVSTYKQEWENAKPVMDALAPHRQMLEQHGINPAQQIDKYLNIHKTLAMGAPEQKLATLMQIAQDYKIPVENMFTRGQDGQIYFNEQLRHQAPPQQMPDVSKLVEQKFAEYTIQQSLQAFMTAKDDSGNPRYPHYETVRETMAQLLEAKLADDLESAYQTALRLPAHGEIFEAEQLQQRQKDEAEKQRKLKEDAERARRNNVSPRQATPAGQTEVKPKGLRGIVEAAVEQHTSGRV